MPIDLDRVVEGAQVRLPGVPGSVTLVAVTRGPFWELFFKGSQGPGAMVLSEGELDGIEVVDAPDELRFDGDAVQFRLGIEAHRTAIAFAYDMAAVAVSNIRPLPHQLEAVYDCFLREPRLRFLLADDPGAGKTIMAGLYMKELILRRAGDRILVVAPASLRPQWVRELGDRFQLDFVQLGSANFDAVVAENPWDQFDRVVVSRDFLRTERAREALAEADRDWDLAVIDEAHGFTLQVDGKGAISHRSDRYKAAEVVSRRAHRLVLMTATPHSGRTQSLWGLLRLLDPDAWGDRMPNRLEVPAHCFRKVSKEIMTDMAGRKLFKDRHPQRVEYSIEGDEWRLYEAVTEFVSEKLREIRGDSSRTTAGFALTTMQRRVASSTRAIRRTLERRVERIDKALADPAEFLRNKKAFVASLVDDPDELEELDEEARWRLEEEALEEWLPDTIYELEAEREALGPLLDLAREVEAKRTERKLTELLEVVRTQGLKEDRRKQLLKESSFLAIYESGDPKGDDSDRLARWAVDVATRLLHAAEDVLAYEGRWLDPGTLPPRHQIVGRLTLGAVRLSLVAAPPDSDLGDIVGVLSTVTNTGDTRFAARRGAYLWLGPGEALSFDRAIAGEWEVEASVVSQATVGPDLDLRMTAEESAAGRWIFRFDGVSLWDFEGGSIEVTVTDESGSAFVSLAVRSPSIVAEVPSPEPQGVVREDPFDAYLVSRMEDDRENLPMLRSFVNDVRVLGVELEIGRSSRSADGLDNYVLIRRRGEGKADAVAVLWPTSKRLDLRLPADAASGYQHVERRRSGKANAYQVRVLLRSAGAVSEGLSLLKNALNRNQPVRAKVPRPNTAVSARPQAPPGGEQALGVALVNAARQTKAETGYNPTLFVQMLSERGGLATAKALINSQRPSDGFTRLWELDRLDLTVEAIALRREFRPLFTSEELAAAKLRLADHGYDTDTDT